jgi:hypothetical protein
VSSLAKAIKAIVTNEAYRIELGETNYKAATAFPMSRITDMYLQEFTKINNKKSVEKIEVAQA